MPARMLFEDRDWIIEAGHGEIIVQRKDGSHIKMSTAEVPSLVHALVIAAFEMEDGEHGAAQQLATSLADQLDSELERLFERRGSDER